MANHLETHQAWLTQFYTQRDWYQYSPLIRLNFLSEEVGELSRAIRTIELGRDHPGEAVQSTDAKYDNLKEELADCFDQLLIICSKYQIKPSELSQYSEHKLTERFKNK